MSKEVAPVGMFGFADRCGGGQRCGRFRTAEQTETCLMRKTVSLERVDLLLGPDEVLETVAATAIAGHNVVEITTAFANEFAGVLADTTIALKNRLTRDPREADRHAIILRRDDNRGNADLHPRRRYDEIEFTNRQLDPIVPRERVEEKRAVEIPTTVVDFWIRDVETERWRQTGTAAIEGHEGLLDSAVTDHLPGAVERQDDGFVENASVHGNEDDELENGAAPLGSAQPTLVCVLFCV